MTFVMHENPRWAKDTTSLRNCGVFRAFAAMPPTFSTLTEWLDYQQRVHARGIDLGLDRVLEAWQRMGAPVIAPIVITVGGTNGKGSTVAFLEAMLRSGGMRVGAYTSPHLLRYNERVRIDGADAKDAALIDAFARIEAARRAGSPDEIELTYFEFGTLAAFDLFARAQLDVALLEVGLGGRLDAVNIIDADAAIVTTVDLDHMEYLGNDREAIGREKAGIFRAGRPAIVGEADPPRSLIESAMQTGSHLSRFGRDYTARIEKEGWCWQSGDAVLELPRPSLQAPTQIANAAAAIAALHALRDRVAWNPRAIAQGVCEARLAGRLQKLSDAPALIVDVAHNPQAVLQLALWLEANPIVGNTYAVFGALSDKDIVGIVRALKPPFAQKPHFAHWYLAGLEEDSPRGLPVAQLRERMRMRNAYPAASCSEHIDVAAALDAARARSSNDDRIIAFGSFFVVAAVLSSARDG